MVTREEVQDLITEALRAPVRCRADYPHEGKLRYIRGNPSVYNCECGQQYLKNGRGGLMDAPKVG